VIVVSGEYASFVYPWKALERFGVRVNVRGRRKGLRRFSTTSKRGFSSHTVIAISHVEI